MHTHFTHLTPDNYFHKEASYDSKRSSGCLRDESFWIIRKRDSISEIKRFDQNPIKTSYELLWSELKEGNRSNLTIQNVLRRILEYYFTILGNRDKDSIVALFEGEEQLICSSLFSWINEGSHFANDDLYVSGDEITTDKYMSVFRTIFERSGHEGHYHMMMGTTPQQLIKLAHSTDQEIRIDKITTNSTVAESVEIAQAAAGLDNETLIQATSTPQ